VSESGEKVLAGAAPFACLILFALAVGLSPRTRVWYAGLISRLTNDAFGWLHGAS
jgi:hypothetical protein